jgi:hypothetical protein
MKKIRNNGIKIWEITIVSNESDNKLPPKGEQRKQFLELRKRIRNYKIKYPELSRGNLLKTFNDDIEEHIRVYNLMRLNYQNKLLNGIKFGGGRKKTKKKTKRYVKRNIK